jgi:hypothetical protein
LNEQRFQALSSDDEPDDESTDQTTLTLETNLPLQNIDLKDPLEDDSTETRFIPTAKPDATIENMINDAISELEQKEPTQKISIADVSEYEESSQNISSAYTQQESANEHEISKTHLPSVLQEYSLDNNDTNENTAQPSVSETQNTLENSKQMLQKEASFNSIEGVSELTPIIDKPSEEKNESNLPEQIHKNHTAASSTHQERENKNILSPHQTNFLQSDPEAIKKFTYDHIKQINAASHITQLSEHALDFFKTFLSFVVFFKAKDSQTLAGVSFQSDFTIASSIEEIICSINQPHFISQSIQKRIPFYGNLSDEDKTLDLYFSFGKFPPDAAVFFPHPQKS